MNGDLHMAGDLQATDKANLFVIFGEPDIEIHHESDGQIFVQVKGVDVFGPSTGEVGSDSADGIACWFIDTDYEESLVVRHARISWATTPRTTRCGRRGRAENQRRGVFPVERASSQWLFRFRALPTSFWHIARRSRLSFSIGAASG